MNVKINISRTTLRGEQKINSFTPYNPRHFSNRMDRRCRRATELKGGPPHPSLFFLASRSPLLGEKKKTKQAKRYKRSVYTPLWKCFASSHAAATTYSYSMRAIPAPNTFMEEEKPPHHPILSLALLLKSTEEGRNRKKTVGAAAATAAKRAPNLNPPPTGPPPAVALGKKRFVSPTSF